jgi:hypothetical protein
MGLLSQSLPWYPKYTAATFPCPRESWDGFFYRYLGVGRRLDLGMADVQSLCYPLVMTNIAMEAMAHRNRWFTY